jgi:hypothetical protein
MNTMDCFATIESRFTDWHYDHPKILYGLIRSLRPQVVVEVGTYRGYAACYMARAIQENNSGRLYCIDKFSESKQRTFSDPVGHWNDNLVAAGVRDWVTLLSGSSKDVVWPDRVDVAYIDGWHGLEQCVWDFAACSTRGAELICLDDTQSTVGPKQLLADMRRDPNWDVIEIHRDNGFGLCYRRKRGRRVEFSQELPDIWGTDLKEMNADQIREHLAQAKVITGLSYENVL